MTMRTTLAVIFTCAVTGAVAAPFNGTYGFAESNGMRIAYESFGTSTDETILLIPGWGVQLTIWPKSLVGRLVEEGFHVVRYDNRDSGLSTHLDDAGQPDWESIVVALESGTIPPLAYTIQDMANDAAGLLDALDIHAAHIVGFSMGGHIAQRFAIHHPERSLSLVSIASDAGNPDLPGMSDEVLQIPLLSANVTRADIIDREVLVARTIGSREFPTSEEEIRRRATFDLDRAGPHDSTAGERQTAAIIADGDRRSLLGKLDLPTVVLHGDADPMVPLVNGQDTAQSIPGAELRVVKGLGHDLPEALVDDFAAAILAAAERDQ